MKKIFALIVLVFICFSSCEKDDFCTQNPVTPKLILRFYDNVNRETIKTVDNLYVWAEGKDTLFVNESTDSLVIPLNSNTNQTIYNLSKDEIINQFTINYDPKNEYVSRSCGFKVIFDNLTFNSDNIWIQDFTPNTLTAIDNQNTSHVQVFH